MSAPGDLRRRRRASARAALYAALALLGAAALGLWGWLERLGPPAEVYDWRIADFAQHPAVRLLQRYIAVDTSLPDGDPQAGAELVAEHLRAGGVEVTLERVGDKDAVLWAVLEGDDPRAIVLHHHVDVDPIVHPELWSYPPFEGTLAGPWIYGRGAFDMKSVAVAQMTAFRRLAETARAAGRKPARTVILLATTGEEEGSDLGMKWLLRRHPELVARFAVVLTEGGAVEGRSPEDVKYWGTEFVQNRGLSATVCGDRRDRLEALRDELIAEGRPLTGLVVTPELEAFLVPYAPTRDRDDWRRLLADPHALTRDPVAFSGLPAYVQSMFRNEAVPFPIRETDGGWELPISLHLLPGADPEEVLAEMLPPWRVHGLGMTVEDESAAAHGSPPDAPVLDAIAAVIHERYPEVPAGPLFLPWTLTDARFVRAAGVPAYGFSPFMVLTPEVLNLVRRGTVNERIALPGFVEGVDLYSELLERLAAPVGDPAAAPGDPPRG